MVVTGKGLKLFLACSGMLTSSALFASPDDRGDGPLIVAQTYVKRVPSGTRLHQVLNPAQLRLGSRSVLIVDLKDDVVLYGKNVDERRSIASLTKLMTAMVVLDARQEMTEQVKITDDDKDFIKFTRSRLKVGAHLTRRDLLYLALAASENRSAHALARAYPGGKVSFIAAMNRKAKALGMTSTRFSDSSGLSASNTSTARDLLKMVRAAHDYPIIRNMTTISRGYVRNDGGHSGHYLKFKNTNRLLSRDHWDINISKTGYIKESGYCLVMHARLIDRPVAIILLNSHGKFSKFADANRVRRWLVHGGEKLRRRSHYATTRS